MADLISAVLRGMTFGSIYGLLAVGLVLNDSRVELMDRTVDDPGDVVDEHLDVAPGDRSLQRNRRAELPTAEVAEETMREIPAARCLHRCLHRRRDLHLEPGARGAYREAVRAVDEADVLAEALREAGLEELLSLPGVEPAHVEAVDLHACSNHVGAGRVEVVRIRAAGRECEAAHGE